MLRLSQLANDLDQFGDAGEIIYRYKREKNSYSDQPAITKLLKELEDVMGPAYEIWKQETRR
jgi:hypothetical protein